jgi:gamma-glutamylcysteine synthetase
MIKTQDKAPHNEELLILIGIKNMMKAHWIILYLFVCLLAIAIPHWI